VFRTAVRNPNTDACGSPYSESTEIGKLLRDSTRVSHENNASELAIAKAVKTFGMRAAETLDEFRCDSYCRAQFRAASNRCHNSSMGSMPTLTLMSHRDTP
jgi:hypothetical protein